MSNLLTLLGGSRESVTSQLSTDGATRPTLGIDQGAIIEAGYGTTPVNTPHGLGRIPRGVIVLKADAADGAVATTWDASTISMIGGATGKATVLVF